MAERTNPHANLIIGAQDEASPVFDKIKASSQSMAAGVEQAATKAAGAVGGIGDKAAPAAQKLDGITASMIRQVQRLNAELEAGGARNAAYFEKMASVKGADLSAMAPYLADLKKAEAAQRVATTGLDQMGMSAKQTTAALRQVPMQFTDIVVSLQGGQSAMQVFLQQGGQLKDMFGGAGNAVRAMGGYVAGLVTPFTMAAAAIATIAVAYKQGSAEADGYRMALVMTGNAAGTTAAQMQQMAGRISSVVGTQGAAADALAQMASSGRVASQSLEYFSEVAIKFERTTGTAISETVKRFAELGASPVDASRKLNEETNYLTASIYEQIKALKDQGREADAAALAQNTYADALNSRSAQITQNLGAIEGAWKAIKDAAKSGWDAMLNVGRADSLGTQIDNLRAKIAQAKGQDKNRPFSMPWDTSLADLEEQLSFLTEQERVIRRGAEAQAQRTQAEKDAIAATDALQKTQDSGLTNQQKMNKALEEYARHIEKLKATNPASVLLSPDAIARGEKAIRDRFSDKGKGSTGINAANKELADQARLIAELSGLTGTFSKDWDDLSAAYARGGMSMEQLVEKQAALLAKQPAVKAATEEQAKAKQLLAKADLDAAASREKYITSLATGLDKIRAEIAAQEEATARMGLSKEAIADLDAAKLEMLATDLELQAIKAMDRNLDQQTYDALKAQAQAYRELAAAKRIGAAKETALEIEKANDEAAKKAQKDWERAAEQINSSLTDALLRGFESGKDFAKNLRDTVVNMFKTMVLRPIISAVVNPVAGALTGALGLSGAAQAATGGASALGMLGNVGSIAAAGLGTFGTAAGYGASALFAGNGIGALAGGAGMVGAGSLAGGFGMIAGVLAPIALGIGALVAISKATKGETRTGGQFVVARDGEVYNQRRDQTYSYAGQQYDRDFSGGARNPFVDGQAYRTEGDPVDGTQEAAIKKAVSGTADAITNILKTLGSEAVVTGFWAGLETSGKGRGGVYAGGSLSTGAAFGESGQGDNYAGTLYEKFSTNSPDFKAALENFTLDLKQATLQALQQVTDLPKGVQAMLKDVDIESLDLSAVDELLTKVADYPNQLLQSFGSSRDDLVKTFAEGLATGDAMAAGQMVADQFVAGVEASMLGNAASQIFDIVNTGIMMPVLDAIATGSSVSEALAEANIEKTIAKAQATATAFAAIWNDESFKSAMGQIRSTMADALGSAGSALQYQPRYIQQPARELTQAADAAAKAAEDARKKWEDLWKSLRSDRDSAEIDLLRAMGDEEGALARERARAIEGMDAEQAAYWDGTRAILDQVAALEVLNGLREDEAQLQIELLQARGDEQGALALITKGMSDAERAAYLYNAQLRRQVDAVQALASELPALIERFLTPQQRQAAGYERISTDLARAGISVGADVLQGASMDSILAAATAVYQMGETSDETRLALVRAVSGIKDLRDAALELQTSATQAAAAAANKALGARNTAGGLLDQLDKAMGGKGNTYSRIREAELWAAMQTASYQQQIEMAGELTNIVLSRYQEEKQAAEQQLGFAKQLKEYVAGLQIGALSPKTLGEKLAEAGRQYQDTLALAQGGDEQAQGRLQGAANAYLDLARQYFASSDDYTAIFEGVTGSLSGLSDSLMSDAERQLSVSSASLDELQRLTVVLEGAYATAQQDYLAQQSLLSGQLAALQAIEGGTEAARDIVQGLPALLATQLQQQSQAAAGVIETALTKPIEIKPAGEDVPTTIVTPAPIDWSWYQQGNDALVAEIKALREEVKVLREERLTADGQRSELDVAIATEHARRVVEGVGEAVQQGVYQASVSKEATYK